jgi:aspartyl/glutamyl-tRNA(Asn/Gln) amidotransferase C subunit
MPQQPTIDQHLLHRLAGLARLRIEPDQEPELQRRLQAIVAAFADLPTDGEADTDGLPLPLRPDTASTPPGIDVVLTNAAQVADGQFVVPRVLDA